MARYTALLNDVDCGFATKTLLQIIAAANHQLRITEVGIGFNGASGAVAARLVELLRQTTAGTMTALALVKENDSDGDSPDASALHTATAEPTAGDILRGFRVHPCGNGLVWQPRFGEEIVIGAADRIGLRVTGDGANAHDADCYITFEE